MHGQPWLYFVTQSTGGSELTLPDEVVPPAVVDSSRRTWTARQRAVFYGSLILFVLLLLNLWSRTGLLFTHRSANVVAAVLTLFLPAVAIASRIPIQPHSARVAVGVLLWPLAVVSAAAGILLALGAGFWEVPGFTWSGDRLHGKAVQVVDVGHHRVAMYPNDGGATSETGAHVQQECTLVPGVLVVRYLYSESSSDYVTIATLGPDRVRLDDSVVTLSELGWPLCR